MRYTGSIALMLAVALQPGWMVDVKAAAHPGEMPEFGKIDSNGDGNISQEELIAAGMDDLAFRAMDINGDGSLSVEEYARRQALEEQPAKVSGGNPSEQPSKRR